MNAFLFALLTSTSLVAGDISVKHKPPVNDLVSKLLPGGAGITVTKSWLTGNPRCSGIFKDGASAVPNGDFPDTGIILSTGSPKSLHMQDTGGAYTESGEDSADAEKNCYDTPGDLDLDLILAGEGTTNTTKDACVLNLEFNIDDIQKTPFLTFKYVFGSDEYLEWVHSAFNDVFALYLNGQNLAYIPGTSTAVTIDNVNNGVNSQYFYDNDGNGAYPKFEADGFTGTFKAAGQVKAGKNTLKLAIGDTSDCYYDSWVILEGGTLKCVEQAVPTIKQPTLPPTPPPQPTLPPQPVLPSSFGDPHFTTFGGEKFDYHGACDLVLLKDPKFAHGLGLTVHIRTERKSWWSFIKAATVQIGEDTLEVMGGTDSISYWMNGGDKMEVQTGDASLGDFPLHFRRVNGHQTISRIDLGHGDAVAVETFKHFVRVNIMNKSNTAFVGAAGLLGAFPHGAKVARDGVTVMEDSNAFGQEWQVRVAEPMLFHEVGPVQAHEECAMPDTTTSKARRLGAGAITEEDATLACARVSEGDRDACIFDVMATQDKDMAGSY